MPGRWQNEDGTQMECLKPDCDKPIQAQGLCKSHYNHYYYLAVTGKKHKRRVRRDLWKEVE